MYLLSIRDTPPKTKEHYWWKFLLIDKGWWIGLWTLIISNVKSTCGCTIPKKPEKPILPGESDKIQVKYDTKRIGFIRKSISVTSNASNPSVVLKITGQVVANTKKTGLENKKKSIVEDYR